jgi:molybdopterin synthase sulfur carrier subunit
MPVRDRFRGKPMKVNFYATLRPIVGARTVDLALDDGLTIRQLIDVIVTRWPALHQQLLDEQGVLFQHVHIFINGRDAPYRDGGLDAAISQRDTVDVFPAVAGG